MSGNKSHILNVFLNEPVPPSIVKGEGVYLYEESGKRYIDGSSGPVCCTLGHGNKEMAQALMEQMEKVAYVFRMDFTTPALEEAAGRVCELTGGLMDRVFFVSGGSEATENAVKLARKYHIDNGEPGRFKVISRWLSYHGMTTGALTWSGMSMRRADYLPYLHDTGHIPPAFCYRCWFNREPETCNLECAQALENEIMCQGPQSVSAFIVEPISGMSLCAAVPRQDYFKRIREICDRHGVLLIFDEVLTCFGRCGAWFGFNHFDVQPDIIALGKGLAGGYFPTGAMACQAKVAETIARGSGLFSAGHTWAGNPMGAAVVNKTIDIIREQDLITRSAEVGAYLGRRLEELRRHPTVGDVRGKGMMWGLEFVKDKDTREPLDSGALFWIVLKMQCLAAGLNIDTSSGADRGQGGDMMMIAPPLITTEKQVDEIVGIVDAVLTDAEKSVGF